MEQEPREQRVIIILADISGYTKFMVENHLSAVHGQMVISHLLESLLREVDIPLELQEIEGDAIFLFATRPDDASEWEEVLKQVQTKLLRFFEVFILAAAGLGEMTACKCAVCKNADELKLKIIAHTGRAVFHSIGGRRQVSGADVILAHRLLKNSLPDAEYLLLSDAAYQEVGRGLGLEFHEGQESYESLGTVKVHVHYLTDRVEQARDVFYALEPEQEKAAIREYIRQGGRWFIPAAFEQLAHPTSNAGWLRRVLFIVGWACSNPSRRSSTYAIPPAEPRSRNPRLTSRLPKRLHRASPTRTAEWREPCRQHDDNREGTDSRPPRPVRHPQPASVQFLTDDGLAVSGVFEGEETLEAVHVLAVYLEDRRASDRGEDRDDVVRPRRAAVERHGRRTGGEGEGECQDRGERSYARLAMGQLWRCARVGGMALGPLAPCFVASVW